MAKQRSVVHWCSQVQYSHGMALCSVVRVGLGKVELGCGKVTWSVVMVE